MAFYLWSKTAASNSNADNTINWAEGQAPSSINDSARAMMARTAEFRDDIAGALVTGGTSTAYTVTSNQVFDSLAHMDGKVIAFTPNATSTNAVGVDVTLSVDGLTAKPIRMQPSVALPSGTLVLGTPYIVLYSNTDGAFYLRNTTNPYSIPLGASIDFWGTAAPNSSLALMYGQAISRTTYATLFSLVATTYGSGDGSTTFNIPDVRGRVIAGKDDMGGSAASRLTSSWFGGTATNLGAVGGGESNALSSTNQIPQFTPSVASYNNALTLPGQGWAGSAGAQVGTAFSQGSNNGSAFNLTTGGSFTITMNAVGSASPSSFRTCQPTIIGNKLMRII